MRRAAIVAPRRTPVGAFGGSLRPLRAEDLAARIVQAVVAHSSVDPSLIDDVVFAQSYPNSEAPCIGRWRDCTPGCRSNCWACRSTAAAAGDCKP